MMMKIVMKFSINEIWEIEGWRSYNQTEKHHFKRRAILYGGATTYPDCVNKNFVVTQDSWLTCGTTAWWVINSCKGKV